MTLQEAIKELEDLRAGDLELGRDKAAEAEGLGIEALKLNWTIRETYHAPELLVLPGETERKEK